MTIGRLLPKDLQWLLHEHGHDLGQFGVDGIWGAKTAAACEAWFGMGNDLAKADAPQPDPDENVLLPQWLPDCSMRAIVVHWTAGSYNVSETDKEHYHFIVGGDGKIVKGDYSIKANVSTSDVDGYAAHTRNFNTKVIGISAAAMANAIESPFNPGTYPLTSQQWAILAQMAAELCRKYKIAVTTKTVLQHGEVQKNLGIAQAGKWDINKLPWLPSLTPAEVGKVFREEVSRRL